ncbi:MAG: universal stress protein [Myxococcales bacterium]|jgi:nucleotide-binding universal stress UspA family protein
MSQLKKILVATDFSDVSERALAQAVSLARTLGASIDVVHVYDVPAFNLPLEGAVMSTAAHEAELSDQAQASLDAVIERHAQDGVAMHGTLRRGVPYQEIAAFAEAEGADLIVIGTHGRQGASHVLLGSVAERVVRIASCPVMTVPVRD